MVQGRALKAMQLMDARQATSSMNLSYLQALLANLFFSFRDFVLSCKKLLFWNDLGSTMVSDRPILAFKVDLFFQSFRLRWWWKSEKSGFAEDLTKNFQFLVSWQNEKLWEKWRRYFVSHWSTESFLSPGGERHLAHWSQRVYIFVQLFKLFSCKGRKLQW